jgi:hypothetical protein
VVLQGGPLDRPWFGQAFHLQNIDDLPDAAGGYFSAQQHRLVHQLFADGAAGVARLALGQKPLIPAVLVQKQPAPQCAL